MIDNEKKNEAAYTGYEYREITVPRDLSSLCMDSYPCFGWEPDPNKDKETENRHHVSGIRTPEKKETETLYFRRNRNLCNKAELTRLQRNFDSCVSEVEALKKSKKTMPLICALTMGIVGTAFMAGSTFAVVADPPIIWLTILLAIPGFLGWILPYFLYQMLVRKKTMEIEPLMEEKYDEIYTICEKGTNLLH